MISLCTAHLIAYRHQPDSFLLKKEARDWFFYVKLFHPISAGALKFISKQLGADKGRLPSSCSQQAFVNIKRHCLGKTPSNLLKMCIYLRKRFKAAQDLNLIYWAANFSQSVCSYSCSSASQQYQNKIASFRKNMQCWHSPRLHLCSTRSIPCWRKATKNWTPMVSWSTRIKRP